MGQYTFNSIFQDTWNFSIKHWKILSLLGLLFYYLPQLIFSQFMNLKFLPAMTGDSLPVFSQLKDIFIGIGFYWVVLQLLSIFLTITLIYFYKKKSKTLSKSMTGALPYFGNIILLSLLLFLILMFGYLLLIIPGIILSVYLSLALYSIVLDNASILESLEISYNLVKGRWWKVFGYLLLLSIVFALVVQIPAILILLPLHSFSQTVQLGISTIFVTAIQGYAVIFSVLFVSFFYTALKKEKR